MPTGADTKSPKKILLSLVKGPGKGQSCKTESLDNSCCGPVGLRLLKGGVGSLDFHSREPDEVPQPFPHVRVVSRVGQRRAGGEPELSSLLGGNNVTLHSGGHVRSWSSHYNNDPWVSWRLT